MAKPIDLYIRQQQTEIRDSLNKAFDFGWDACEERIIKLLEEHKDGDLLFAQNLNTPSEDVAYTMFKSDVIALIKGESKSVARRVEIQKADE